MVNVRSSRLAACLVILALLAPVSLIAQASAAKPSSSPAAKASPSPSAKPSPSPSTKPATSPAATPKASAPAASPKPGAAAKPSASAKAPSPSPAPSVPKVDPLLDSLNDGLYALIDTAKGKILASLDFQRCPLTVTAFVGLAEGTIKASTKAGPFYDELSFHRVISKSMGSDYDFMIQAGDPAGEGNGGPGFSFPDELDPALNFSGPGMLAMANSSQAGNGSQFFITLAAAPWLDQRNTIFGQVISGQDVANRIVQGDRIIKVSILRKGKVAEAFRADAAGFEIAKESAAERTEQKIGESIAKILPNAQKSANGISFVIDKPGSGAPPLAGQTVNMYYSGSFLSGRIFDSNMESGQPASIKVGTGRIIAGWDQTLMEMKPGEKRRVLLPPDQAFGATGIENVIPPNAWLLLDIELVSVSN